MAKVHLEFENKVGRKYSKYRKIFLEVLLKTLEKLEFTKTTITVEVLIVSDPEIQELNLKTRGQDEVTDVLSYAYNDRTTVLQQQNNENGFLNLGSIVINALAASRQAELYEHELTREFKFLFVHGLLHLFGYDHDEEENEQVMLNLQNEIIGKRGT